jgi:hypothetical protein
LVKWLANDIKSKKVFFRNKKLFQSDGIKFAGQL